MKKVTPRPGTLRIRPHMIYEDPAKSPVVTINIGSNESAFGASPAAVSAAIKSMDYIERYSETAPYILSHSIATHFGLNPDCVVCGFGSDDLLARIARAYLSPGDELVYSVNGYQKIPNYAYANDAEAIAAPDDDFKADVDAILKCVTSRTRVVMIANPDNPTGSYISGSEVRRLHAGLPENVLLVMDSAYLEYVDAEDYEDPTALVEEMENVVMTRTFSKIYGLAALRLGWMYAPANIADVIKRIGITFPVSTPALYSGMEALKDEQHTQYVHSENIKIKQWFTDVLNSHKLLVYPSQTNFLLVKFPDASRSAPMAYDYLAKNGIATRRQASKVFADFVRFTIGLDDEMSRTADALKSFFKGVNEVPGNKKTANTLPLKGESVLQAIKKSNTRFIVALPDIVTCENMLWPISSDPDFKLIQVCKEDEGVSICAGLSYCKQRAILLIQHTGFLDSINAIRAIAVEYQLPIVMIVGLQGMENDRMPEQSRHIGIRILEPFCKAMELDYSILVNQADAARVEPEINKAYEKSKPYVFFVARSPA